VDFIEDFIDPAAMMMLSVDPAAAAPAPAALVSTPGGGPSGIPEFVNFLSGMSTAFNGRFTRFGSGTLPPPGDPFAFHAQAGDANDDGCVNSADYALVQQLYGQRVSASSPNTYRADVNLDALVGSEDYQVIAANYGMGCTTSAGTIPVLGGTVLGFELASNWSSPNTALAVTAIQKTEGEYSMKVGATGWRELSSVKFPSSAFGTVKAKLAFDVFIPTTAVNPAWLGQVLAFISIPSANINNLAIGSVELTGKPKGAFTTANFTLPQNVKTALGQNRDVTLRLVVNSGDTGHRFDNVRLVP
jgi:hypothetical protein